MAIYMWREYQPPELCFTANTASSYVYLRKQSSPTAVTLETSTDGENWTAYTWVNSTTGSTITLSNIGDKVYFRNTSETTTTFSTTSSAYYYFVLGGDISASGDVTSLINKNCTDTLSGNYCFYRLFYSCTALRTPPKLLATTLTAACYQLMFYGCNLITLPELPALTLKNSCYSEMFKGCSTIKLSETQTGEYQTAYRIPTTGTGTDGTNSLGNMFYGTGGTFTGTPSINTTYYTSNQVI